MASLFGFGSNKPPSKPPKAVPLSAGSGANTGANANPDGIESVMQRSVKISFPKGAKVTSATEDNIYRACSMFGTIMDIRIKGKHAVVLYSTAEEANRCIVSFGDTQLAADHRIRLMGSTNLNQSTNSLMDGEDSMDLSMSEANSLQSSIDMSQVRSDLALSGTGVVTDTAGQGLGARERERDGGIAFDANANVSAVINEGGNNNMSTQLVDFSSVEDFSKLFDTDKTADVNTTTGNSTRNTSQVGLNLLHQDTDTGVAEDVEVERKKEKERERERKADVERRPRSGSELKKMEDSQFSQSRHQSYNAASSFDDRYSPKNSPKASSGGGGWKIAEKPKSITSTPPIKPSRSPVISSSSDIGNNTNNNTNNGNSSTSAYSVYGNTQAQQRQNQWADSVNVNTGSINDPNGSINDPNPTSHTIGLGLVNNGNSGNSNRDSNLSISSSNGRIPITTKIPKVVRVTSPSHSEDGSPVAGLNKNTTINNTYISSANETSPSRYSEYGEGDGEEDSEYTTSTHSQSQSQSGDGGMTFLTQSVPSKPRKTKIPSPMGQGKPSLTQMTDTNTSTNTNTSTSSSGGIIGYGTGTGNGGNKNKSMTHSHTVNVSMPVFQNIYESAGADGGMGLRLDTEESNIALSSSYQYQHQHQQEQQYQEGGDRDRDRDERDYEGGNNNSNNSINRGGALTTNARADSVEVQALINRIRVLEAEARVQARERQEFEEDMRMAEENWSIELTALGIRNRALEGDVGQLKEETRRQKIAYSKIASHAAYLEATTDTAEMSVGNSKAKADREAYAALLAQQKMMTVLDSHKEASEKQRILLAEEVSELSSAHKEMVAECLKWKIKAIAAEEENRAVESANRQMDADRRDEEAFGSSSTGTGTNSGTGSGGGVKDSQMQEWVAEEESARRVLNNEISKYVSLERSVGAPVLAQRINDSLWQFNEKATQFDVYFNIAERTGELNQSVLDEKHKSTYLDPTSTSKYTVPKHWHK